MIHSGMVKGVKASAAIINVIYNSPPWFSVTLPDVTTEDIEVHNCANINQETNNEDSPIGLLEIYVQ